MGYCSFRRFFFFLSYVGRKNVIFFLFTKILRFRWPLSQLESSHMTPKVVFNWIAYINTWTIEIKDQHFSLPHAALFYRLIWSNRKYFTFYNVGLQGIVENFQALVVLLFVLYI